LGDGDKAGESFNSLLIINKENASLLPDNDLNGTGKLGLNNLIFNKDFYALQTTKQKSFYLKAQKAILAQAASSEEAITLFKKTLLKEDGSLDSGDSLNTKLQNSKIVVDKTEKYKKNIVEVITNKSHFGVNQEFVVLI
jgi:hypothetical protein